jgi:hypothetical protein
MPDYLPMGRPIQQLEATSAPATDRIGSKLDLTNALEMKSISILPVLSKLSFPTEWQAHGNT